MRPDDIVNVKEIKLEKIKIGCARMIGSTLADSLTYDERGDIELDNLLMELRGFVLGDRIAEEEQTVNFDFEHPTSWWQMFKEQKFMGWCRKRWPVEYETERKTKKFKFERFAAYPRANINIPKDSQVFKMQLGGIEVIHDIVKEVS